MERSLTDTLFALDAEVYPLRDIMRARDELEGAVASVGPQLNDSRTMRSTAALMAKTVFGDLRITCSPNNIGDDFSPTAVLAHRYASCLGIALIYLAIAEPLHIPVYAVLYDQHVGLRFVADGSTLDVEPRWKGMPVPPSTASKLYPGPLPTDYGTPLTTGQILAIVRVNRATIGFAARGDNRRALEELNAAIDHFPGYATAWVNKAVVLRNDGRLSEASESLMHAAELSPGPQTNRLINDIRTNYLPK